EGMVYGTVRRDGWRATSALEALLLEGKFLPQIHLVLLDGIALGGFNVVDLPRLAHALQRPCIAVMRKLPDLPAMERAARRLSRPPARLAPPRRGPGAARGMPDPGRRSHRRGENDARPSPESAPRHPLRRSRLARRQPRRTGSAGLVLPECAAPGEAALAAEHRVPGDLYRGL